jgi:hypothetical protein
MVWALNALNQGIQPPAPTEFRNNSPLWGNFFHFSNYAMISENSLRFCFEYKSEEEAKTHTVSKTAPDSPVSKKQNFSY